MSSTTTTAAPQWYTDLSDATKVRDEERKLSAIATILGLTPLDQMPKGSQVAGWGVREWEGWLSANGYEKGERQRHGIEWTNKRLPQISCTLNVNPGDPRGSMNLLRDIKQRTRAAYLLVEAATRWLIARQAEGKLMPIPRTAAEFAANVIQIVNMPDKIAIVVEDLTVRRELPDANEENCESMRKLLDVLKKEFDIPARKAMRECGLTDSEIESMVLRINTNTLFKMNRTLVTSLQELLDTEREIERAEKEKKRRERDARDRETAMKEAAKHMNVQTPLPITKLPTPGEKHAEAIRKLRGQIDHDLGKGHRLARELAEFLADRHASIDMLPFPSLQVDESETLKKRIAELENELRSAREANQMISTQTDLDHQAMLSTQNELTKAKAELAEMKALMEDPAHTDPFRVKYEGLVASLKPLLFGTGDISTMLSNLDQAKLVVKGADADINSLRKAEGKKS